MNTLDLDLWLKPKDGGKSEPIGLIHFRVSEEDHKYLEDLEQDLASHPDDDLMVDLDTKRIELQTPPECGELSDCKLRVYVHKDDHRGHFHLVGHRASDGSLVYSDAVMVDQLG